MTIVLSFITSVSAYAAEIDNLNSTSSVCFTYNGHGEFTITNSNAFSKIFMKDSLNGLNTGDKIIALPTQDTEFYQIKNTEQYLAVCSEDKYILTDKIELDIYDDNEKVFNLYNISDYLRDDIQKVIQEQNALNNSDLKIDLYVPSEYKPNTGASVNTIEPTGTNYYTYTYNGKSYKMKDVSVRYTGLSIANTKKGSSTLNTAKNFASLVFASADGISRTVAMFGKYAGIAMSAYDLYKSIRGEVIKGTAEDKIYTNIPYAKIVKETYAEDTVKHDYPNAGCVSHKVWLDTNETTHFYSTKGKSEFTVTNIKEEIFSPHFKNPAPTAINNGISAMHYDLPLKTTLYGTTYIL